MIAAATHAAATHAASAAPLGGHVWHLVAGTAPLLVALIVVGIERARHRDTDRDEYLARPAARALLSADSFGRHGRSPAPAAQRPAQHAPSRSARPVTLTLAAFALVVAAGVHLTVMPAHFRESWLYGAFFLGTASAQVGAALLVWARPTRLRLRAIGGASLGVVLLWAWTRVVGIPLGPGAGETESIGFLDVVAGAAELITVTCCFAAAVTWAGRVIPPSGLKTAAPDGRLTTQRREQWMGSWTSDSILVDFMRAFVVATNRLRYAEERNEVDAATMTALQRSQRAAATAFEAAVLERGWQLPSQYGHFPLPRVEAVSF